MVGGCYHCLAIIVLIDCAENAGSAGELVWKKVGNGRPPVRCMAADEKCIDRPVLTAVQVPPGGGIVGQVSRIHSVEKGALVNGWIAFFCQDASAECSMRTACVFCVFSIIPKAERQDNAAKKESELFPICKSARE